MKTYSLAQNKNSTENLTKLQWPEQIFKKCQLSENETLIWEAEDLILSTTAKEGIDDKNLKKASKRDLYIEMINEERTTETRRNYLQYNG